MAFDSPPGCTKLLSCSCSADIAHCCVRTPAGLAGDTVYSGHDDGQYIGSSDHLDGLRFRCDDRTVEVIAWRLESFSDGSDDRDQGNRVSNEDQQTSEDPSGQKGSSMPWRTTAINETGRVGRRKPCRLGREGWAKTGKSDGMRRIATRSAPQKSTPKGPLPPRCAVLPCRRRY